METPTITSKQEKKTLSAKKPKKQTIKTVLSNVYEEYWPLVEGKSCALLKTKLTENLPRIRIKYVKIPYSIVKDIPKNERKQFRYNYPTGSVKNVDKAEVSNIVLGINSVMQSLEKDELSAILVAPIRVLVRPVIDVAVHKAIPVLVINGLKMKLKNDTGVTGVAIGFKSDVSGESKLRNIINVIRDISHQFPIPSGHIHYHRRINQECDISMNQSKFIDDETGLFLKEEIKPEKTIDEPTSSLFLSEKQSFYLKRDTKKNRVFTPELSKSGDIRPDRMDVDSTGFLGLSPQNKTVQNIQKTNPLQNKQLTNYRALIVKKLKGDKNRTKRKLHNLKKT